MPVAVEALRGTGVRVASVAGGFPAGLTPLDSRLQEIRDVVATLPRPVATLWNELSGPTAESVVGSPDPALVRRTGYAR